MIGFSAVIQRFFLCGLLSLISMICAAQTDSMVSYVADTVLFVGRKIYQENRLQLSNAEFKKLAASFDDPSRVLLHYPGFTNANDQANGIIYHGLPSHMVSWQLHGMETVNPNHLSNAGTLSDLGSLSAGGVNMFSGNIIDQYIFQGASNPGFHSNTLGGVSNIAVGEVKNTFIQASLLGLEAGLKKSFKKDHHLFASYRYSFTGLLGDLGVNFGGETIRFNDLVAGYRRQSAKSSTRAFFAWGKSENLHPPVEDSITSFKDGLDITYKADMTMYQILHDWQPAPKRKIRLGASYSRRMDYRTAAGAVRQTDSTSYEANDRFRATSSKLTLVQSYQNQAGLSFGIKEILEEDQYYITSNQIQSSSNGTKVWTLLPYLTYQLSISSKWSAQIDLAAQWTHKLYATPKTSVSYHSGLHALKFSIGRTVQRSGPYTSMDIHQMTSLNSTLEYRIEGKKAQFTASSFLHQIDNLFAGFNYYNVINGFDYIDVFTTQNYGKAKCIGISLMLDLRPAKSTWININHTQFDLKYKNEGKAEWLNAETNFNYSGSLSAGKDFLFGVKKLSLSASFHYRGGQYYHPVYPGSHIRQRDYDFPPIYQMRPYLRLDARINYTWTSSLLSLDIQNLSSRLNDGYPEAFAGGIRIQKQLGLLPVLSFKKWW